MKPSLTLSLIAVLTAGQLHAQLALIRQGDETRGVYEDGDRMGSAVCAGDFNGDGYDDLAAGSPGERYALLPNAGFVTVNYGSSRGLSWTGTQGLGPAQGGLDEGLPHLMGAALASADFNADGCDDLAVGLPASAVSGNANAGRVLVFLGSGAGLQTPAALVLTQSAFGGANEAGDEFGATLAAGKLGTDNFADLVIGGPGENNDEGAVFIIRGAVGGLDVLDRKSVV